MIHSRAWAASGLLRPSPFILPGVKFPTRIATRASSLSAIHRGLRRSEDAQYGGSRDRGITASRRPEDRTARSLAGSASVRQQHKLKKKLTRKAEEKTREREEGTGRQTRRKRFADSQSDFGKKSLVYQLKYGDLKDKAASMGVQEPVRARSFRSLRRNTDDFRKTPEPRRRQPAERDLETDEVHKVASERSPARRKKVMMPMNIKYTTAASQFLYGKSVVKAALEQGRRKLYQLYIYGGETRKDAKEKDNAAMQRLAEMRGVPIKIVPNEEQRLMDKMSMGRPHNGFVLEASPLPKLPITSLGKLEETPSGLGFQVTLDFQTKEEAAINGTSTFIPRSSDQTPKPFVLLLNEILDPGNLGALIRTASYLGVDAIAITNRSSSTLTPVVLKSAAGAAEEVSIFTVDSPEKFIENSRIMGWKTYAAVAPPDRKLQRMHGNKFISMDDIEQSQPLDSHPCILVLGNEGHGLSKQIKMAADHELSVPRFIQNSSVDSLNVSVAAGLLCHAFVKQPVHKTEAEAEPEHLEDEGLEEAGTAEDTAKEEKIF